MKKVICLLTFLNITLIFAQDLPFTFERLGVDFYGVTYNERYIIAYGNGGIMLRTSDRGRTWEQFAIVADSIIIKKIKWTGKDFIGLLSDSRMIKSSDGGDSWFVGSNESGEEILDFAFNSDSILILKKDKIEFLDFNFKKISSITFDSSLHAAEVMLTNKFIYVAMERGKILTFDLDNNLSGKIIDFEKLGLCQNCGTVQRMKSDGDDIYASIGINVFKSTDRGNSWGLIYKQNLIYNVYNGNIYDINVLTKDINYLLSHITLFEIKELVRLKVTEDASMDRFAFNLRLTDYDFLSKDTIVAVGIDKLISMSFDGGKSWELISHFEPNMSNEFWVNENYGFICGSSGRVYRTSNGGTTWLPQKFTTKKLGKFFYPDLIYFDSTGSGFVYQHKALYTDENFLYSRDFGDTYIPFRMEEIAATSHENRYKPSFIRIDSLYYLYLTHSFARQLIVTDIIILDSMFQYKSHILIPSMHVFLIKKLENGTYIAMGREKRNYNGTDFDSTGFYFIRSKNGIDWEKSFLITKDDGLWYWQNNDTLITNIFYYDKFALIAKAHKNPSKDTIFSSLFLFDLETGEETNLIPYDTLSTYQNIFLIDEVIYCGTYEKFYRNKNLLENPFNWEQLNFRGWVTSEAFPINDDLIYLAGGDIFQKKYNYLKLRIKKTNAIIEIPKKDRTKFWAYPPYPQPANETVKARIYWDRNFDINKDKIVIYDVYGRIVGTKEDITINIEQPYCGELVWNCGSVSAGVYLIVITHGNADNAIPVIISR